ncbi:FAD/NAD-binding domain-containing protein [Auriculariales sp. MPI-PUGE-AT-0066]|nr:FAD/NAD-binding domain-containing protein [Auriculariales sp. MPI-PUGE-AT-0066]
MAAQIDQIKTVLPTLDVLGVSPQSLVVDAKQIAQDWLQGFAAALYGANVDDVLGHIVADGFWRDFLALTWEMRTFHGHDRIRTFLTDRLAFNKISDLQLSEKLTEAPALLRPYEDLAWVQLTFTFSTAVGIASAIVRLIPSSKGDKWRAHTIFTNLEELHGHPPKLGPHRDATHFPGTWSGIRKAASDFENEEPAVLILGAGQSGLGLAARLKYLGVRTLLIDREPRIGNQWRGRYESLCLHDTVWYDHMPMMPYPPSWPVWTPSEKLADWLESYAKSMDLDIWFSSNVLAADWDDAKKQWAIKVSRNGEERIVHPRHVISAIGLAGGVPNLPPLPDQELFKGSILHFTSFKTGRDFVGKKVLVVGACTSGHDVSADLHAAGVDVTMLQRNSTYIMSAKTGFALTHKDMFTEDGPGPDRGDRLLDSYPFSVIELMHQRVAKDIRTADKDLVAALEKAGFRVNRGTNDAGFWPQVLRRGGGYYLDVGASNLVASGAIKLVVGTEIQRYTETGVVFTDGRTLDCDVVIFATGFGDFRIALAKIFGKDATDKIGPVWGVNAEGEVNGVWRIKSGHPGLYLMQGNLALCRFHSSHMALQIKAIEVGLYSEPYLK